MTDENAETIEHQPEPSRGHIPKEIGRYKVRRVIGSGGMGTVYEAMQESPRRKVAIKVMRSGVTSKSAMRRFEYESQILGRLSHPCIAQVYEAGTYDDGTGGVPYFAMEYIIGAKTLLEYANQKDLNVHEKLILFEQVCDAVHHGHLKGIIHRDLKPDNILVDSSGNPKIIDFGVARSTDSDMVVTTLQTNVGQLIGTVQYMSPEQCEADPDLIDARSDVYSLGVILYELLTGQVPYNLSSIPIYEATRLIREQQPTKMTTIAEGIQGDLETIVSKSMDKDRDRRYQSSYEIGQDITRFLENEPIHARRASMVYQLKMFARRNKAVVATVCTIAVALVLATVVSVYAGIRASQAEATAIIDRDRAIAAEAGLLKVHTKVLEMQSLAEKANEGLRKALFDAAEKLDLLRAVGSFNEELLSMGTPRNAQGKMCTVLDIALQAINKIDQEFAGTPLLEAPARRAIGELLWELGELEHAKVQLIKAIQVFKSAKDSFRPHGLLHAYSVYAKVLLDLGDVNKSRSVAIDLIEGASSVYGLNSEETLKAKNILAEILEFSNDHEGALELQREIVDSIDAGVSVSHEFDLDARIGLAGALYLSHMLSGAGEETRPLLIDSLLAVETLLPTINEDLGILHPISIDARILLASCLMQVMRIDESVPILEQAYEDASKIYGPNHYKTAEAAGALGSFYFYSGISESENLLREAIKIYTEVLGTKHPSGINFRSTLGQLLVSQNRFDEAETILQQNMQDLPEGPSFARTQTIGSLAYALMMQGKFEEGEPLWQVTVDELITAKAGESSQGVDGMRFIKAQAYILNSHPNADEVADEFILQHIKLHGSNVIQLCSWTYVLGQSYFQTDRPERGLEFINSIFNIIRSDSDSTDDELFSLDRFESHVALLCIESNKYAEALEILERITPSVREKLGETHEKVIELQVLLDDVISKLAEENVSP
ncbi:MAG: serine/threonine protein kinase [Phycisphaerae bacterium]|nr:serine/threonine protein kinase [Phycisphaerae bacterium]